MSADKLATQDDASAIESRMGSHVEEIMFAARKAATQLQAEVEQASAKRAAEIEAVAARRAHAVRMSAEAETERLLSQARLATQQYLTASRRLIDEYATERMQRISAIADRLSVHAEALVERLTGAELLARQVEELRSALGVACERIAAEVAREDPKPAELVQLADLVARAAESESARDAGGGTVETIPSPAQRLARAAGRKRPAPGDAAPADAALAATDSEEPIDDQD